MKKLLCCLCAFIFTTQIDLVTGAENCDGQHCHSKNPGKQPNVVIMLADDLGVGDLSVYGSPTQEPGPIDQMAAEGIRFTQFYSADSMCSPSRAALLTGRLPIRTGVVGGRRVFLDYDSGGLPKNETTLPEALRNAGYRTGMVGKWHLGINEKDREDGAHLPSKHGFDFVGYNIPMTVLWDCDETGVFVENGPVNNKCHLYKGDKIYQQPIHLNTLTQKLVSDFKEFVVDNPEDKPFFFYFSFPHVHAALWASKDFKGKSSRGLYGDNLNEMSWAVGEVRRILAEERLDKDTLLIFLSDHGPHKEICIHGGSTGGFRGGKSNSFEGGFRIPAIITWPGRVAPGTVSPTILSALDIFPTILALAGAEMPENRVYDGIPMQEYLLGDKLTTGHELTEKRPIFFYCNKHLMAVRYRRYKVHFFTSPVFGANETETRCPHGIPLKDWYILQTCNDEKLTSHDPPLIFDLHKDPYEAYPLDPKMNDRMKIMYQKVLRIVKAHEDSVEKVPDQLGHYNPRLIPCCNYPKCTCNYPD